MNGVRSALDSFKKYHLEKSLGLTLRFEHDTDPDIFREALAHSETTTGFTATLIEKDYYSSLILQYFFDSDTSLVFKGGTCLSKVAKRERELDRQLGGQLKKVIGLLTLEYILEELAGSIQDKHDRV